MAYFENVHNPLFLLRYNKNWRFEIIMGHRHLHRDNLLLPKCGSLNLWSETIVDHGPSVYAQWQKVHSKFHECDGLQ